MIPQSKAQDEPSEIRFFLTHPACEMAFVRAEDVSDGPMLTRGTYERKALKTLSPGHDVRVIFADVGVTLHNGHQ